MKAPSELMHRQAGPDTVVRIEILEGVRGFLATWVMVGHFIYFLAIVNILQYVLRAPVWMVMAAAKIEEGVAPVAIFMIISGFVISHLILTRREKYPAYITRRFLRLFPAFACCLLLGIIVSPMQSALSQLPWGNWDPWVHHQADLAGLHRAYAFRNILAHLTFMHGFIPRSWWPDATGAFLGVGWSIATEWQFYLVAPFLIFITRKTWGFTALICLLIFLSPLLPFSKSLAVEFQNESKSLLLFHLQYFFIGGVCYRLWRMWREYLAGPGASRPRPQGLIVSAAIIAFFVPDLTLSVWIFIFACLCQIAAAPHGIEARIVQAIGCSEPAQFIGRISYSIYLAHWPVSIIMLGFVKYLSGLSFPAVWILYMVFTSLATIGVSTLLYYYVEAPAMRWGKKLFKEDRPAPDVVAPVSPPQAT